MKFDTPEISWHGRDPVYSIDVQASSDGGIQRIATGGTDSSIRIWHMCVDDDGKAQMTVLASLKQHTRGAVNIVRFSPDGSMLASGGDDCYILIWKLSDRPPETMLLEEDEEPDKEQWLIQKRFRGHIEDVYDLSWSADGLKLMSGSVDNTAGVWDVKTGKHVFLTKSKSFVQGVGYDPLGELLVTLSCDRSCRVYNANTYKPVHHICRFTPPECLQKLCPQSNQVTSQVSSSVPPEQREDAPPSANKLVRMFHDDSLRSFFRRLSFSPCGQLLVIPSACVEMPNAQPANVTFIFTRASLPKPVAVLPCGENPSVVVRFCPTKFKLRHERPCDEHKDGGKGKHKKLFDLPYRYVFAVGTEDCVFVYDTELLRPIGFLSNLHYSTVSDMSWSPDGRFLLISSTDGYCTVASFSSEEIGEPIPTISKSEDTTLSPSNKHCSESPSKSQSNEPQQVKTDSIERSTVVRSRSGRKITLTSVTNTDSSKQTTQSSEPIEQPASGNADKPVIRSKSGRKIALTTLTQPQNSEVEVKIPTESGSSSKSGEVEESAAEPMDVMSESASAKSDVPVMQARSSSGKKVTFIKLD